MSLVLSIATHGDPSQVSLALRYPEQCDECHVPLHDWRPRQRYCAPCVAERNRRLQRERYRNDAAYRAAKIASVRRYQARGVA